MLVAMLLSCLNLIRIQRQGVKMAARASVSIKSVGMPLYFHAAAVMCGHLCQVAVAPDSVGTKGHLLHCGGHKPCIGGKWPCKEDGYVS
jgi:hypothetical protein